MEKLTEKQLHILQTKLDAKHQIEDMLIDHWNEEIDYLENRIQSFQDE